MSSLFLIAAIVGIGFAAGYGTRAVLSRRRRRRPVTWRGLDIL
jgi:hypothetical protein